MFSWLTGGGGIAVTAEYDSSITPGKKGMLSEPIEDMTAEKFKELWWKWVPNQEPVTQYEVKRECMGKPEDKCMVRKVDIDVSGIASLLVTFKGSLYFKYLEEGDCLIVEQYGGDETLKNLGHKTIFKLLPDPFRIEVFDEEISTRRAGPFVKQMFEGDLKSLGVEFEKAEPDQDSPSQPGQKSCIASGIKGELTSEGLWQKSEFWMRENGGVSKEDGSLFLESAGWISATTYYSCKFDKDTDTVIRLDHGEDSSGKEVIVEMHTKVLQDPVRVERWVFPKSAVSSDARAAGMTGKTIDAILAAGQ